MKSLSLRADAGAILLAALAVSIVVLAGCSGSGEKPVAIRFDVAESPAGVALQSLQFYVHDVELLDEEGKPHRFALNATAPWQTPQLALIDLAGGAPQRNSTLTGTVATPAARYAGIRFTVGVPFELNHANPLSASAPLDRSDLFWTWQSGHKFLRADLASGGRDWSFHLGSTGCSSASALRPPAQPCSQPNRVRVQLAGDPVRGVVRFRLEPLVAAAADANHIACTGAYSEDPACAAAYATTGLEQSGNCPADSCARQTLWTLEP